MIINGTKVRFFPELTGLILKSLAIIYYEHQPDVPHGQSYHKNTRYMQNSS